MNEIPAECYYTADPDELTKHIGSHRIYRNYWWASKNGRIVFLQRHGWYGGQCNPNREVIEQMYPALTPLWVPLVLVPDFTLPEYGHLLTPLKEEKDVPQHSELEQNGRRAQRGSDTLSFYMAWSYSRSLDLTEPEAFADVVADLVGDIGHLAAEYGHDYRAVIDTGLRNLDAELDIARREQETAESKEAAGHE